MPHAPDEQDTADLQRSVGGKFVRSKRDASELDDDDAGHQVKRRNAATLRPHGMNAVVDLTEEGDDEEGEEGEEDLTDQDVREAADADMNTGAGQNANRSSTGDIGTAYGGRFDGGDPRETPVDPNAMDYEMESPQYFQGHVHQANANLQSNITPGQIYQQNVFYDSTGDDVDVDDGEEDGEDGEVVEHESQEDDYSEDHSDDYSDDYSNEGPDTAEIEAADQALTQTILQALNLEIQHQAHCAVCKEVIASPVVSHFHPLNIGVGEVWQELTVHLDDASLSAFLLSRMLSHLGEAC